MAVAVDVGRADNPYLFALQQDGFVWSDTGYWQDPVVVRYTLANDFSAWTITEADAYRTAIQAWGNVANITFAETTSTINTELIAHSVPGSVIDGNLGVHQYPSSGIGQGEVAHGWFNHQGLGWSTGGLSVGGFGYLTLLHEIGQGLGLAHPHDGSSHLFPGVTGDYSTGSNGLNQNIFTVMSYVMMQSPESANANRIGTDTWSQNGQTVTNFGYFSGPMAFDIAAIQDLYGANMTHETGNNVYRLPDQNALNTYWTCIWDAGGNDTIQYDGNSDATISLVAATLDNSPTGGGALSWAQGIMGGYTIANGVVIENATGGGGNDTITGNDAGNTINGRGGADTMSGLGDGDTYFVDNIGDQVIEVAGGGLDAIYTSVSYTIAAFVEEMYLTGNTVGIVGDLLPVFPPVVT